MLYTSSNKMVLNMKECERHTPQGFLFIGRNGALGMW